MSAVQKDGPYAWFFSAITLLITFLILGLCDSFGIIVAVFIVHYKESNAKGGWLGSIVSCLMFALAPFVVYLHNRIGFRWCMLISSVFYCSSLIVTPFVQNMNYVFLTFSIPFGISTSFISVLSVVTQREYFSKYYGLAIGLRYSANALGSVVISLILPFVFDEIGFKDTFLALISLSLFILCYGFASRLQVTSHRSYKNKKSTKKIYWEFLQDKSFTLSLIGILLFMFCILIPHLLMVRYGMTLGYPLSKAKWLLVLKGSTSLIGTLIIGRINDKALKYGKVKLIALTACIMFGVFSLLCSFAESFPFIMVYMASIGLVEGVWWASYPILIVEITSGYRTDEAFSLATFVVAFVRLPGPPLSGWLFDVSGDFRYVLYVIFVISMIAAFLIGISSRVKVEKHFSLKEKSNARKTDVEGSECEEGVSQHWFDNPVSTGVLLFHYETSV